MLVRMTIDTALIQYERALKVYVELYEKNRKKIAIDNFSSDCNRLVQPEDFFNTPEIVQNGTRFAFRRFPPYFLNYPLLQA